MKVNGFEVPGVIRVDNVKIYGLEESIIASSYPMATETRDMSEGLIDGDIKRARHLGKAIPGSGHDCFLKGITLQFDLQVPEYIWRQLDRYHFIDYISSQSKMHRILKMDLDVMCNKFVTEEALVNVKHYIDIYNNYDIWYTNWTCGQPEDFRPILKLRNGETIPATKENLFKMIIANTPSGIMLTARMTTNYLQLKSIINQRSNHKMEEWRLLTAWLRNLPMVEDIVLRD